MDIEEQYDKIFRFCYYRVHNTDTAQDLTQETFLRFMNSDYKERGEQIRYLYTIAETSALTRAGKLRWLSFRRIFLTREMGLMT